jgi:ATP-dependent Clp protease adaptor protein ClpS
MSDLADVAIDEKIDEVIFEPGKYKVVMLNDDATPMDWVIEVLMTIFKHSQATAENITLGIHNEGAGIAGVYTYEVAEQKSIEAVTASRERGFPLQLRVDAE